MTAEDRQDVRERLAARLHTQQPDKSAHWSQVQDRGEKAGMYRLADAILADPSLVVLRAEDVEQVGWASEAGIDCGYDFIVARQGAPDETPVYRIKGWTPRGA